MTTAKDNHHRSAATSDQAVAQACGQALGHFATGRFHLALRMLEPLVSTHGILAAVAAYYCTQAHLRIAMRRLRMDNPARAITHLHQAAEVVQPQAHMAVQLAACLAGNGAHNQAGNLYSMLAAGSVHNRARLQAAMSYYRSGDMRQAQKMVRDHLLAHPQDGQAHYYAGLIYAADERYPEAAVHLESASLLCADQDGTILHQLGRVYGAWQRCDLAVQALLAAQQRRGNDPTLARELAIAGHACLESGIPVPTTAKHTMPTASRSSQSLDDLAERIAAEPEFVKAFLDMPRSDMDAEVFGALIRTLQRALERHPDYADLYHHCSLVYQRLGCTQQAVSSSEQALRLNPRYTAALIQLADLYAQQDDTQQAIERLETALEIGANYADVHYLLGNLYRRTGRIDDAVRSYQQALHINQHYAAAREALEALAA